MTSTNTLLRHFWHVCLLIALVTITFHNAIAERQPPETKTETFYLQADLRGGLIEQLEMVKDDLRSLLRMRRAKHQALRVENMAVLGDVHDEAGQRVIEQFAQDLNEWAALRWQDTSFRFEFTKAAENRINADNIRKSLLLLKQRTELVAKDFDDITVDESGCFTFSEVTYETGIRHHWWRDLGRVSIHRVEERNIDDLNRAPPSSELVSEKIPGPLDVRKHHLVHKRMLMSGEDVVDTRVVRGWWQSSVKVRLDWMTSRRMTRDRPAIESTPWALIADNEVIAFPKNLRVNKDSSVLLGPFNRQTAERVAKILLPQHLPINLNDTATCSPEFQERN